MRTEPRPTLARALLPLALLIAAAAPLSAQLEHSLLDTQPLSPDTRLLLDLHAGDYQVATSPDSGIHVVESRNEKNQATRATNLSFRKTSGGGRLEIDPVSNNSPHITISLPTCAALDLRLTAGELVFDTAPCLANTVTMHAGELRARMSDPDSFHTLAASVSIGEISAPGLGKAEKDTSQGGFFRTFKRSGNGSRTFTAHVGTGQITLDGRKQ